jgi:hypothetical protein
VLGDSNAIVCVTEIWYSSLLSEKTYNYLCASLEELLLHKNAADFTSSTNGLIGMDSAHFQEMQYVWKQWLDLKVVGTSNIRGQRNALIRSYPNSSIGLNTYYMSIPNEHVPSAMKYMKDGVFQCTEMCTFAENPTLTGHPTQDEGGTFSYCIPADGLPFTGWDYIKVKKFGHNESLVSMYANYIGSKLTAFMEKLSSKQVSFDIVLGDCMKIDKNLNEEEKYDRILTSNLMDYILLPKLLRYVESLRLALSFY